MKLVDLLSGYEHTVLQGDPELTEVRAGIAYDSRRMTSGSMYIAMRGTRSDGHEYILDAVARGAVAVLVEHPITSELPSQVCVVQVADTRKAVPALASRYFGQPAREMDVVAVTGTNGKTSTTFMIEAMLRLGAKARVGVIGTEGCRIADEPIRVDRSTPTTPESIDLQHIMRCMRDRGAGTVAMEASSIALILSRVEEADINVGIFTNLTLDHQDTHGSMEAYKQAKLLLFQGRCKWAVVNADDPVSADIIQLMPKAVSTFGIDTEADYQASNVVVEPAGTRFTLRHVGRQYEALVPIPGRFAVYNAMGAIAACHILGYPLDVTIRALASLPTIPGRFETYQTPAGVTVVVDLAHSTDAIENVLTTIRGFATGRVVTVLGCGGGRDHSKRTPMGEIAGKHSDLVIVTNDNPRNENPEDILDEIMIGVTASGVEFKRTPDRRTAIRQALALAQNGDVVLIAGKGAEKYQIFSDQTVPFNDMEVAREVAAELPAF